MGKDTKSGYVADVLSIHGFDKECYWSISDGVGEFSVVRWDCGHGYDLANWQ
jgi:hypothetical protein